MYDLVGINPTATASATQAYKLRTPYVDTSGTMSRYFQVDSGVTISAAKTALYTTATDGVLTNVISAKGVFVGYSWGTATTGQFIWVYTGGPISKGRILGPVSINSSVVASGSCLGCTMMLSNGATLTKLPRGFYTETVTSANVTAANSVIFDLYSGV